MPRYFFSVREGRDIPDEEGLVLEGPEEARAQAVTAAGEALRDLDGRFWQTAEWQMRVTDEEGVTLCTLRFSGTVGGGQA